MDMLADLGAGFGAILSPTTLFFCFAGVTLGTLVGALPGLGALVAISLSLPFTFRLDPTDALVMLAGIFYGAQYGGSTASILLNVPGTPSSAITCLEGYPLARQGKAGTALVVAALASFIGGSIAILLLMFFAPALGTFALRFSPFEYFSVMFLALACSFSVSSGSPLKGLMMTIAGLALGTVGTDSQTATLRYTFGQYGLADGVSLIAMAMGVFGVAEILEALNRPQASVRQQVSLRSMIPTRAQMKEGFLPSLRGSLIGFFTGILPGAGPSIATMMSYSAEKRLSREPGKFENGALAGLASPEAANNASVQAAFIPTLSLGIPGDVVMAVLIGALLIHGITPGPSFVTEHKDMFWTLVASFWIGNVMLLILNVPLIGLWVRLLHLPGRYLHPMILLLIALGVYSVRTNPLDVAVAGFFGVAGIVMKRNGYPAMPLLMGFVLGPLMEAHFQRAMLISEGDLMMFVERPISGLFMAAAMVFMGFAAKDLLLPAKGETDVKPAA